MFKFLLSFLFVITFSSLSFADCPRDSTIDYIFGNYDFRVGDKMDIDSQVWKVVDIKSVTSLTSRGPTENLDIICDYKEPDGSGTSKIVTLAPNGRIP